VKNLENGRLKK